MPRAATAMQWWHSIFRELSQNQRYLSRPIIAVAVFIGFVLHPTETVAQSDATPRERAMNEEQMEMSICAAYLEISRKCLGNQDQKLSESVEINRDILIASALKLGLQLGLTQDAMISRMLNASSQMRDLTENNCLNFSSLLRRHSEQCKSVLLRATARL